MDLKAVKIVQYILKSWPHQCIVLSAYLDDVLEERIVCSVAIFDRRWHLELVTIHSDRANDLLKTSSFVWNLSIAELPEDDAEAVDVGRARVRLSAKYLRRHPLRRPNLAIVLSDKLPLIASQPKVADFDGPLAGEKYVLRLEVAVQYSFGVQVLQG